MRCGKDFEKFLEKYLVDIKTKTENNIYIVVRSEKINGKKYELVFGDYVSIYDSDAKYIGKGNPVTLIEGNNKAEFVTLKIKKFSVNLLEWLFIGEKYYMIPRKEIRMKSEKDLLGKKGPRYQISIVPQLECKKEEIDSKYSAVWL